MCLHMRTYSCDMNVAWCRLVLFPWQPVWPKEVRAGGPAAPLRDSLIYSLKACQQGSLAGSLVNYVNALIPFHFPTYQLPWRGKKNRVNDLRQKGTEEGIIGASY